MANARRSRPSPPRRILFFPRRLALLLPLLVASLVGGQQDPALPGAAQFRQGELLFDQTRHAAAVAPLGQAAKQGHPAAVARLGHMLHWGAERHAKITRDCTRADGCLRSSAAKGCAFGQTWLGQMLLSLPHLSR